MKIREFVTFIPDGPFKRDDYSKSIEFIHSFGLKCDCVGWTEVEIKSEEDLELLKQIREKANQRHIRLRGDYVKLISDVETDWYILDPRELRDENYNRQYAIKGYKVPNGCHVILFDGEDWTTAVSENFVKAYEKHGLTGAEFVWVPDNGRYDAMPFYSIIPQEALSKVALDDRSFTKKRSLKEKHRDLLLKRYQQADSIGGNLTFLEGFFDELSSLFLPLMIDKDGMPDADFAYAAIYGGRVLRILIRKSAAEKLIEENVLSMNSLKPALYFDAEKHSKMLQGCPKRTFPILELKEELEKEKAKWLKKKRPKYVPTEKLALTTLRRAKREDSSNYNKPLKKAIAESLEGSPLECMIPYYRISNGGWISDEIEYFAYEDVAEETKEFLTDMEAEETILEEMPELKTSIAIGRTMNGDTILLESDGSVLRYDHEEPPSSIKWNTVFEFFFDNIEVMS